MRSPIAVRLVVCSLLVIPLASGVLHAQAPAHGEDDGVAERPADRLSALTDLPEKAGRRVTHALREHVSAIPWIRHASRVTEPDGAEDLMVVLEVSRFERCVRLLVPEGRAALRAAREQCRGERGVTTSVAHVRLGPTPASASPGTGGEITLVAFSDTLFVGTGAGVSELRFEDIDGDGRREAALQVVVAGEVTREAGELRSPALQRMPLVESFVVLDGDLRVELSVVTAESDATSFTGVGEEPLRGDRANTRLRTLRWVALGNGRFELEVRPSTCAAADEACRPVERMRFTYDTATDTFRRAT